jgi:hypothetical protein
VSVLSVRLGGLAAAAYHSGMLANLGWEEILLLATIFAAGCGRLASAKGYRTAGWAFLGFWCGPFALLILAVLPTRRALSVDGRGA